MAKEQLMLNPRLLLLNAESRGRLPLRRRSVHARAIAFVVALSLMPVIILAGEPPSLSLAVGEDVVTVSNGTPRGTIILFSCERGSRNGRTHVRPRALALADEEGDGKVSLRPEGGVPLRSVWVAIDFSSGATATGGHPRFPLLVLPFEAASFRRDAAGAIAALDQELGGLILLVVRPDDGAWMLSAYDGARGDGDGARNARVSLAFDTASTIEGKKKAPKHLKAGDVIAAIDPSHLDVYLTRIGK
jgi:hypothetical protein